MKKETLLLIKEEEDLRVLLKLYPTDDIDILKALLMRLSILTKDVNVKGKIPSLFIETFYEEIYISSLFLRQEIVPPFLRIISNLAPKHDILLIELSTKILLHEILIIPPKILWTIAQCIKRVSFLPPLNFIGIISKAIESSPNIKAKMNLSSSLLHFLPLMYSNGSENEFDKMVSVAKKMSSDTLAQLDLHSFEDDGNNGCLYVDELRNSLTRILFYAN